MTIPKIFTTEPYRKGMVTITNEYAQHVFEIWLKENSKVVYGFDNADQGFIFKEFNNSAINDTKALVVCIGPIEKNKCEKHEPGEIIQYDENGHPLRSHGYSNVCKNCGVKLRPVYEAYEEGE